MLTACIAAPPVVSTPMPTGADLPTIDKALAPATQLEWPTYNTVLTAHADTLLLAAAPFPTGADLPTIGKALAPATQLKWLVLQTYNDCTC